MVHIKKQLADGLKEYLINENEQALAEAYELGRNSLIEGIGELDLIIIYHEVISEMQSNGNIFDSNHKFDLAATFLTDVLAPYEIRQRGYRELISKLNRKNELLEEEIYKRKKSEEALQESKDKFQSLIENGLDIITVLNYDGTIRYSSPSVERVLAYQPEELKGKKVFKYIHPDDIFKVRAIVKELNQVSGKVVSSEFRFQHRLGGWIILESVAKSVIDSQDGLGIIVNSRDISYRVKFRKELEDKSRQLEEAQHIARVGNWEWKVNEQENELSWSKEMCRIYGLDPEEFDNSFASFIHYIHPDDLDQVKGHIEKALETKSPFGFEHRIIRPDKRIQTLFCKGEVVTDPSGQIVKVVGIGQDITEQKEAEERLREYSEKLRKLSAKVEQAREEERIRIAREIHDELGQMLTVLKMEFSILIEKVLQSNGSDSFSIINKEKNQIIDRVDTIIKSVQRITTDLRPEVLDDLGLKEAIEWQAQEFEKRTGIKLRCDSNVNDANLLEEERSTAMFRIFQETLTNVARHAGATEIDVSLSQKDCLLMLTVQDNGIGITQENIESSGSLGIIGMKERAQLLGGKIRFEGIPDKGTTVTLEMPLNPKNQVNH